MAHRSTSTTGGAPARRVSGAWVVVAVLLAIGIVVPLLVPVYARTSPTLFGFPFYFWFQFALIPVVSALTYVAFRLSLRATERDRATLGLPTDERPQDRGDGPDNGPDDGRADPDGPVDGSVR